MKPVRREDILDYRTYETKRESLMQSVLKAKAPRRVHLGELLTFLFENTETMRHQIQEMIRIERITGEDEIQFEIKTYNEVLGGPGELGCTLLIEIDDPALRDRKLRELLTLCKHLYVESADGARTYATYDPRQVGEDRLSSVQYIKFNTGGKVPEKIGSDHPAYTMENTLTAEQKNALREDLASDG